MTADHRGKIHAIEDRTSSEPGRSGPAISLSHSGDIVACALGATDALGIDIEQHRSRNWNALAAYAFGEREQRLVSEGGATAFFRIWTLREAWAKATGEGLGAATDGCDRVADGPATGLWSRRIDKEDWLFGHYGVRSDLSLSIAALLPPGSDPSEWSVQWCDAENCLSRAPD